MKLRELKIGDRFISQKNHAHTWSIKGNCIFNSGHGSSTRMCLNEHTNEVISKSCNLEVIQLPVRKIVHGA